MRRSLVLTGSLAALVLAGCAAAPTEPAENAVDTPAAPTTRSVTHERGTTDVPQQPARIVVLEPVQLDTAVALGSVPVGAAVLSEATGVPAYLADAAPDVEVVGTVVEPDLERIAALTPDLVLGTEARHSELYDRLSTIAPTVFMASGSDPWQDNVRFVGDALGEPEQAIELLAGYDDRCAEVAAEFATDGRTVALIRPREDTLSLYGPTSFAGSTLECAGLTLPDRDWGDSIAVDLSPELVQEARADLVLVTATTPGDDTALPPAIAAVRESAFPDLHVVDQSIWITGVGPLGGLAALDDLARVLGD